MPVNCCGKQYNLLYQIFSKQCFKQVSKNFTPPNNLMAAKLTLINNKKVFYMLKTEKIVEISEKLLMKV